MPRFKPSVLISEAYGSVGDITFYHRDGKCYYRQRTAGNYPGTPGQLSALAVHRRALAAWRTLDQATQEIWNAYGMEAISHKPPYDNKAHISGQNLFVSAYHGFATFGNEHVPVPQRPVSFPPFAAQMEGAVKVNGALVIRLNVTIHHGLNAGRYWMLCKIQLTEPGKGKHPGYQRNFLADTHCGSDEINVIVPGYAGIWGLDLDEFQVHARFVLLDTVTGYRSQEHLYSTILRAT